jgi:hypothetical protein
MPSVQDLSGGFATSSKILCLPDAGISTPRKGGKAESTWRGKVKQRGDWLPSVSSLQTVAFRAKLKG